MPTISTGNPGWDQNLSTLGNALFPDPSKIGQAYYYGAEARKAQAETNKLTNQQNYGFRFMQMQPDSAQPLAPPTYSQPNLPGLAPIINAPSNLPITGGPGPGQAAQPPLSSVIPGPAGPAGGQLVPQTMTPQQAAAATPEMFNNHPANQGTPAPTSSPAPGSGAGLAPNTTGSDGSVPAGDPTARGFHPASVTPAGGGMKMSGPADYNGSPARTPVSLATYVATAVQSGMDAAQASLQGQAYLAAMFKQGSIDAHTYHELLAGAGAPQMGVADISAASAAQVANIQGATQRATTGMTQAGETARKGMDVTFIPSPTDPTQGNFMPLSQLQGLGGTPAFNPSAPAVTAATAPVAVQPGGPGTPVTQQPAILAQRDKTPTYQAGPGSAEAAMNEVADYVDPKFPLISKRETLRQAQANGDMRWPQTAESWQTLAAVAATNAKTPQEGQEIRNKVLTLGQTATVKPDAANQDYLAQQILDQQLAKQFPVPTTGTVLGGSYTSGKNTEPAGASPALEITFKALEDQYFRRGPGTVGDHVASANAALKQLLQEGYINPEQDRSLSLTGETTTISKGVMQKDGTVSQAPHFRVDLFDPTKIDPKTRKPMRADGTLNVQMTPPMSSVIPPPPTTTPAGTPAAPAARAAAPFTTDIGPAPPGTPNGRTTSGGKPVEVRDGRVYR